jgi:hypothetical protein
MIQKDIQQTLLTAQLTPSSLPVLVNLNAAICFPKGHLKPVVIAYF